MEQKRTIDELIVKYLEGTLSDADKAALDGWVRASDRNSELFQQLTNEKYIVPELQKLYSYDKDKGWENIKRSNFPGVNQLVQEKAVGTGRLRRLWLRVAVAASLILCVGLGGYLQFFRTPGKGDKPLAARRAAHEVNAPTSNQATITLSNGSVVYLDSMRQGTVARQAGVAVVKSEDGQLAYTPDAAATDLAYNTLYNPRGSKVIVVTLSDGTRVWLNNETSLRYPVCFVGNSRTVEITGEAYFEVAQMKTKPFRVVSNKMTVEVLGTHFNVNAYADESVIRTTLLEGRVKLISRIDSVLIKPGQQARYATAGNTPFNIESDTDVDRVMAWKNGLFEFDDAELSVIMKQIGRWYDREIVYEGKPGSEKYWGMVSREVPLSDVLKMLEVNGIIFKVDGQKITIKPKS